MLGASYFGRSQSLILPDRGDGASVGVSRRCAAGSARAVSDEAKF